jgi:hypothetical protein
MLKRDKLIDDIFMRGLPADTYDEIATRVGSNVGLVNNALSAVRADPKKYGWTVPHVKRGLPGADDAMRLYPVLVSPDGKHDFDYATSGVHLMAGLQCTVMSTSTQARNEMQALNMTTEYITEPVLLRRIFRLSNALAMVEKEAQELLSELAA